MSSVTTRDTGRRDPGAAGADPTARERELLALTLDVLRERGYDGLTIDEVVARARASKTTIYRRWPSKGELVFAAVTWGIRDEVAAPDTGELRADLIALGEAIRLQLDRHASTFVAVLPEIRNSRRLGDWFARDFYLDRRRLMEEILERARARGELGAVDREDELWDLMPGYLVFRSVIAGRPPSARTVGELVDRFLLAQPAPDGEGQRPKGDA
jgi:AcrR family transcriptional regulator